MASSPIRSGFAHSVLRRNRIRGFLLGMFPFAHVAFSPNKFAKMGSSMQALLAHFMQICLALNSYKCLKNTLPMQHKEPGKRRALCVASFNKNVNANFDSAPLYIRVLFLFPHSIHDCLFHHLCGQCTGNIDISLHISDRGSINRVPIGHRSHRIDTSGVGISRH